MALGNCAFGGLIHSLDKQSTSSVKFVSPIDINIHMSSHTTNIDVEVVNFKLPCKYILPGDLPILFDQVLVNSTNFMFLKK